MWVSCPTSGTSAHCQLPLQKLRRQATHSCCPKLDNRNKDLVKEGLCPHRPLCSSLCRAGSTQLDRIGVDLSPFCGISRQQARFSRRLCKGSVPCTVNAISPCARKTCCCCRSQSCTVLRFYAAQGSYQFTSESSEPSGSTAAPSCSNWSVQCSTRIVTLAVGRNGL